MSSNVSLTGLASELAERGKIGKPIRIGLVGTGEMGTDIFTQVAQMEGICVGAVMERTPGNAAKAIDIAYGDARLAQEANTPSQVTAAIEAGRIAVSQDLDLVLSNGLIDVVIDATGVPEAGADIGMRAINHGKHLVMMNVEADVCIGPYPVSYTH